MITFNFICHCKRKNTMLEVEQINEIGNLATKLAQQLAELRGFL